jgi:hypothetical protein
MIEYKRVEQDTCTGNIGLSIAVFSAKAFNILVVAKRMHWDSNATAKKRFMRHLCDSNTRSRRNWLTFL